MASWDFDTCDICHGAGSVNNKSCPVCNGMGLWEFVSDDNALAVRALMRAEHPANEHVKELCDRRLKQVTPDNLKEVLALLEKSTQESDFDAFHEVGAEKWGWAWVHANRFAIELARLCGVDPTEHQTSLTRLAWKWLTEENQKKVDAPIDKPK